MKGTEYGRILVNSCFTLGLMVGISVNDTTQGTAVANLGWDEVRFPKPIFVGDTLRIETEVLEVRESRSRPDQGIVTFAHRAYNQAGEYKKSADVCQVIIELDEFNEAAWYRLMSNYIQSGQTEAAKYCFDRYVRALSRDEELEEEDMPEFDDLVREIKAGQLRI